MKLTRIVPLLMLAIVLALGMLAAVIAFHPGTNGQVYASVQPVAGDNAQISSGSAVDPGGGVTSTLVVTATLTYGEEGFGPVPRHPLIKPITQSVGSLNDRFESVVRNLVNDHSQILSGVLPSRGITITHVIASVTPVAA